MSKSRPPRDCPIQGCFNRTWASRGLPVCGNCASDIAHIMSAPDKKRTGELMLEIAILQRVIERQTRQLLDHKSGVEQPTAKPMRNLPGVVYYLRVGGYIKIGWTADLAKRMRAYAPDTILLATQPGTRKDEQRLHKIFAAHRTHGREWYAMTPSVMHHIEQVAAQHGTPDPVTFAARPVEVPQPRPVEQIKPRGWTGRRVS